MVATNEIVKLQTNDAIRRSTHRNKAVKQDSKLDSKPSGHHIIGIRSTVSFTSQRQNYACGMLMHRSRYYARNIHEITAGTGKGFI